MYPVTYSADIPIEGRNRLSVGLRYLFALPVMIVATIFGIGAYLAAFVAWFAIVFTGKYPEGLYDFNAKFVRLASRATSYLNLATDESPPLNGDEDPSYTVQVGTPAPLAEYDRVKTGLRLIIGIPVFLLNYVQGIIAGVVSLIAWFAIVFTGKMPEGLVKPLHGAIAYQTKALAYMMLLTEDYPPFSEEGAGTPAGQIG
ncbi:MAG: DUF4389 domain-containing protein, partial [Solirubrobacterales bacterium]